MEMTLNVNIDESMFNTVIMDTIRGLSQDQLKEIIINAINKSINDNPNFVTDLLIQNDFLGNRVATPLSREIVKAINFDEEAKEFKAKCKEYIFESKSNIIEHLFAKSFAEALSNQITTETTANFIQAVMLHPNR